MKPLYLCAITFVLAVPTSPQMLVAQERPDGWPNAQTIVRQFLSGAVNVPVTAAIVRCPPDNPYGDSVWSALLAVEPTRSVVSNLGPMWSIPLRNCPDPRIAAWYRARLAERREFLEAVPVLVGLFELRTPANREFLKQVAFDTTRTDELRSEILFRIARESTWEERLGLYADAYLRTPRLPRPYGYNAFYDLLGSPVADRATERLLRAVEEAPRNSNAPTLLRYLATSSRVLRSERRTSRLRETLVRIETDRQGRFPEDLVRTAREQRGVLDRNAVRPR